MESCGRPSDCTSSRAQVEQELFNNYLTADISDVYTHPYDFTTLALSFASIASQAYAVARPGIPPDNHLAIVHQMSYILSCYVASTAQEVYSQLHVDFSSTRFLSFTYRMHMPNERSSTVPASMTYRKSFTRRHLSATILGHGLFAHLTGHMLVPSSHRPTLRLPPHLPRMCPPGSPSLTFASSPSRAPSLAPFPSPFLPRSTLRACSRRNGQVSPSTIRSAPNKWKGLHCSYVQRTKRSPDLKRHIATHTRSADVELWVCVGVPVSDVAEYSVPAEYMRGAAPCEYDGMMGGCKKTFSRRDALKRHLRAQRGRCYGVWRCARGVSAREQRWD